MTLVYLLIVADSTVEDVLCTVDRARLTEGTKLISYMHRVHLLAIYLRFFTGQTNTRL